MKRFMKMTAALVLLLGGAAQARAEILYATSQRGSQIGIWKVDTIADTSSLLFRTKQVPDSLIFTSNGNILYSALDANQVRLINTKTGADSFVASVPFTPLDLALDPGGKSVLVSDYNHGSISRVNLITGAVGTRVFPGSQPEGLAYDNQGRLFANLGTRAAGHSIIAQLNPKDASVIKYKTGLSGLDGLTFDSFTGKLYATDEFHDQIDVIDPNTLAVSVLTTLRISLLDGIESDGRGNLYVVAFGANIYKYDLITKKFTKEPAVPGLDDLAPVAGLGAPVPEPASLTLLGIGGIALAAGCYRRWRGARLAQV